MILASPLSMAYSITMKIYMDAFPKRALGFFVLLSAFFMINAACLCAQEPAAPAAPKAVKKLPALSATASELEGFRAALEKVIRAAQNPDTGLKGAEFAAGSKESSQGHEWNALIALPFSEKSWIFRDYLEVDDVYMARIYKGKDQSIANQKYDFLGYLLGYCVDRGLLKMETWENEEGEYGYYYALNDPSGKFPKASKELSIMQEYQAYAYGGLYEVKLLINL
jgi:hypothetical protein